MDKEQSCFCPQTELSFQELWMAGRWYKTSRALSAHPINKMHRISPSQ